MISSKRVITQNKLLTASKDDIVSKDKMVIPIEIISAAKAKDFKGRSYIIKFAMPGVVNNSYVLSETVLKTYVDMFDGVPVLARADAKHLYDEDKDVKNIVGDITNPQWSDEFGGLIGTFTIHDDAEWLRIKMLDLWKRNLLTGKDGKRPVLAYSIVCSGDGYSDPGGLFIVTQLTKVTSVDVVVEPGLPTSTIKINAAQGANKKEDVVDPRIKFIKEHAPDLLKDLDVKSLKVEDVDKLFAAALEVHNDKLLTAAALPAKSKVKEPDPKKKVITPDPKLDDLTTRIKVMECDQLLTASLKAAKGLPQIVKDKVSKQFIGKVFDKDVLAASLKSEMDVLQAVFADRGYEFGDDGNSDISLGNTRGQKLAAAMDCFFSGDEKDKNGISRTRSFRTLYVEATGDKDIVGIPDHSVLRQFTAALNSGSWAEALGDSITRQMLRDYALPALQDWKRYVSMISAPKDFRTNRRIRVGGYGEIPDVAEGASYINLASPGDEEVTWAISKKGGLEEITLEMVANDDVGVIRRIPGKLARAAGNTLRRTILDILKDNSTIYDSKALFHADHANLGTAALSFDNLNARRRLMMAQQMYGNQSGYDILSLAPKYLLTSFDLDETSHILTKSRVAPTSNRNATEPNIAVDLPGYNMDAVTVDYWTDATDWVLIADPNIINTFEVGFYNGQEEPAIFVQDMPNVGSMFSNDKITYKLRHIYGVVVLDWRGFAKHVVAG